MTDIIPITGDLITPPWYEPREKVVERPQIKWPNTRDQAQRVAKIIQDDAFAHGCLCPQLEVQFLEWPDGRKAVKLGHTNMCPLARMS